MKRIRNFLAAGLGLMAILAQVNDAAAQTASATNAVATNAPLTGQLAGLAQMAMKIHAEEGLPTKLCGLLWPNSGNHKYSIKKFSMPTRDEERLFCLRTDNQDVVLTHRVETKPDEDTKKRKEVYYRTTAKGDLVLAVVVRFEFNIDDVDNEILKKVTYETFGAVSGDGKKPLAIDDNIRANFEAEKKYWLKSQKKLGKMVRAGKAD
ncbi:MAG TPA: hypothetical protein VGN61_10985 [Verrucomicrobiae bacterium]